MATPQADRCELIREGLITLGSGALLVGSLLVSSGLLGPLPMVGTITVGAIGAVSGNWLANPTYNRYSQLCARFTGSPATQPALWQALGRAYQAALRDIEAELRQQARDDR